ncbi:MAG: hypothetical protein V1802_03510 [Candidatus Aenigmatarchaeota archaeon]
MKLRYLIPAIGLATLASFYTGNSQAGQSDIKANVEIVRPEDAKVSFVKPNIFYPLFGTDAYTAFRFFGDKSYDAKTCLTKKISEKLSAYSEFVYGSKINNRIGFGAIYSISLPNGSVKIKSLPFWADGDGYIEDRAMIGYTGGVKLPLGFNLSSFGEFNCASKKGSEWGYGETALMKELSENLSFGLNFLMKKKADGMLAPKIDPSLNLKIKI